MYRPITLIAVEKGLCGCIHTPGYERYTYNIETPRTPLYVCAVIAIYMNKFEHNTTIIFYKYPHSNYLWVFFNSHEVAQIDSTWCVAAKIPFLYLQPCFVQLDYDDSKTCQCSLWIFSHIFVFECKTTCMFHCHTVYLFLQIMPTAWYSNLHAWVSLSLKYFRPHPYSNSKNTDFW